MSSFIETHGDGVYDVAFLCSDVKGVWKTAVDRGAISVKPPQEYKDKFGTVIMASIKTYGDCVHTLVQNVNYKGPFLPGYEPNNDTDALQVESLQKGTPTRFGEL